MRRERGRWDRSRSGTARLLSGFSDPKRGPSILGFSPTAFLRSQFLGLAIPIPPGLRLPAQGCEERATLGTCRQASTTPTGLRPFPLFSSHDAATASGFHSFSRFPQGSSFPVTLGFVSESLWDSPPFWCR